MLVGTLFVVVIVDCIVVDSVDFFVHIVCWYDYYCCCVLFVTVLLMYRF